MNSQFARNHHLIAVHGPNAAAVRRIERLGGQIIPVYAEDVVPATDMKCVLCSLIALPDGTEIVPVPQSETRLSAAGYKLPKGATEYLVKLSDGVELSWLNHPTNINESSLIWTISASAKQEAMWNEDWKSSYVDPLGLDDNDEEYSIDDLLDGNVGEGGS